jgi:hypothetical protein
MKRGWLACVALFSFMTFTSCVGSHTELCQLADDCERGNDRDFDACVIGLDTEEEVASLHGCDDQWQELVDCAIARGACEGDDFRVRGCDNESENYERCVD